MKSQSPLCADGTILLFFFLSIFHADFCFGNGDANMCN
jgi:hypothetical protein